MYQIHLKKCCCKYNDCIDEQNENEGSINVSCLLKKTENGFMSKQLNDQIGILHLTNLLTFLPKYGASPFRRIIIFRFHSFAMVLIVTTNQFSQTEHKIFDKMQN